MVAERYEARRKEQQGTDRGSWMERESVEREREGGTKLDLVYLSLK